MERKAYILQQPPSHKEFEWINNCRRSAWERDWKNYYPYSAFGNYESWQPNGELGIAIKKRDLFVSVVHDESNTIVAHAALVKNKYGIELGRVFASKGGQGYGVEAVRGAREQAEKMGISEIHMGVSYNRTAMWRAFEESFANHGWQLAILGILPDIYREHDMQWGEILSRAVKGKKLRFPAVPSAMPSSVRQFVEGIKAANGHCIDMAKAERRQRPVAKAYQFNKNLVGLDWHDTNQQEVYQKEGYKPVGIVPIDGLWRIVFHKGDLPKRVEGLGKDLQKGRNPIIYPRSTSKVDVKKIMDLIYK